MTDNILNIYKICIGIKLTFTLYTKEYDFQFNKTNNMILKF